MAKRPYISVLLLFNRQIVRADFGKDLSKTSLYLQDTVDVESTLGDAIQQVVGGHPPLSSRTIVLSSDVWSQIVLLPKLSVADIERDDLDEVLKFEAETLSGINIDEMSLASTPLGAKDEFLQFWVSAIQKSELEDVNRLLESVGCREVVIAHPAGLAGNLKTSPRATRSRSGTTWCSIWSTMEPGCRRSSRFHPNVLHPRVPSSSAEAGPIHLTVFPISTG